MDIELGFSKLLQRIRSGFDPYSRATTGQHLMRDIREYQRAFAPGGRILRAHYVYYHDQKRGSKEILTKLLSGFASDTSQPVWFQLHCAVQLSYFTFNDGMTTRSDNYKQRARALSIAESRRSNRYIAVILNSWLNAALELGDLKEARTLVSRLVALHKQLTRADRTEPWYFEWHARLLAHRGDLIILSRKSLSSLDPHGTWFRKAPNADGIDANLRVHFLSMWARYALEAPRTDVTFATIHLDKASGLIDATISPYNRGLFHHVRALVHREHARRWFQKDLRVAEQHLREARNALVASTSNYHEVGLPEASQVKADLKEVEVKLVEIESVRPDLKQSLARFNKDHPDPSKVAFVMMDFAKSASRRRILRSIKATLAKYGMTAVRADEKAYHDQLLSNVLTYAHGCGFGVAVFDRIKSEQFNPNVALEVGYLMALGKSVCLLKESTVPKLQADLLGALYHPFEIERTSATISAALSQWLDAYGYNDAPIR